MVIIEKEGLLEAGTGTGRRKGCETGIGTGSVKGSEAEKRTGTGREIEKGIGTRIVIVTTGIVTGIEVREESGRGPETEMMMIITGVGNMTGKKV